MRLLDKIKLWKKVLSMLATGFYWLLSACIRSKTYKTIKEYTALIIMVALFFISTTVLRWLDPTAATFDAGVLQVINLTLVKMAVYSIVTWSIFQTIWPDLAIYFKSSFSSEFLTLKPCQKIFISLFVYFFYLLSLVLLSRVV